MAVKSEPRVIMYITANNGEPRYFYKRDVTGSTWDTHNIGFAAKFGEGWPVTNMETARRITNQLNENRAGQQYFIQPIGVAVKREGKNAALLTPAGDYWEWLPDMTFTKNGRPAKAPARVTNKLAMAHLFKSDPVKGSTTMTRNARIDNPADVDNQKVITKIKSYRDVPFTVTREVFPYNKGIETVSVYDSRQKKRFGGHGQKVGSWPVDTFIDLPQWQGVNMQGGVPDWTLDANDVDTIRAALAGRKTNPTKGDDGGRYVIEAYDDDHEGFYKRLDSIRGIIDYTDDVNNAKVWGTLRDAQMVVGDLRAFQKSNMVGPHPKLKAVSVATAKSTKGRGTNPVGGKMNKLEIWGKRWFQKTYGNTYHAVRVYVDDELVFVSPVQYGYGEQYTQTAIEALRGMGYDVSYPLWQWAQENGVEFSAHVNDVDTQKELKAFAAPAQKSGRQKNPSRPNSLDDAIMPINAIKRTPKSRAANPTGRAAYMIVVVKGTSTKPSGYWTGSVWDTDRKNAKRYAARGGERGAEKMAQSLARRTDDAYSVAIYTVKTTAKK